MDINTAQAALHAAGWSFGEVAETKDGKHIWLVHCQRGKQKLVAHSESRANAWADAVKITGAS